MKRVVKPLAELKWRKRAYAVCVLCATTATALTGQTLSTLHSFDGTDGARPNAGLIQATDGNLYGTTLVGGANAGTYPVGVGNGTVFKMTPSGTLTMLYSFCAQGGCPDGAVPYAGLVQGTDGNLYGTTSEDGASPWGTIFKITPSGTLTTVYNFCSQNGCTDGETPYAGLIQGADGNFYGTTYRGGDNGYGTVFKITPAGALTTLHHFGSSVTDGNSPWGGLVQASNGDFYGTTTSGGMANSTGGENGSYGTIFKITPSGTETTLYNFCSLIGCADGGGPQAALIQGNDGNLYGTTDGSPGTVFKITPSGVLTTLYGFCPHGGSADCTDGWDPEAGLVLATDGNFYGTTEGGGANNNATCFFKGAGCGTLFRVTPSGTLTTLYDFCSQANCADGASPTAGLVQAANGDLYGTTQFGGANGSGTVFMLSLSVGPFQPAVNAGGVLNSASYTAQGVAPGSIVSIFGTNLAASTASASAIPLPTSLSDVTSVTFNSIPAGLYFVSRNQINAQLPFNVLPGQDSGTVNIAVTRSGSTSAPQTVTVARASPGIFTTTANGLGQAFAYDNTTGALAAPASAAIGSLATAPISISSGDALILACTGLGSVVPSIDNYVAASDGTLRNTSLYATVLIGGVPAQLIYSVLSPQFVSEYQIGVTPAANTPTGDTVSVQIQIGGVTTSNQVTIAVAP